MEDFNPCGTMENVIKYHVENNEGGLKLVKNPSLNENYRFLP